MSADVRDGCHEFCSLKGQYLITEVSHKKEKSRMCMTFFIAVTMVSANEMDGYHNKVSFIWLLEQS